MEWARYKALCDQPNVWSRWMLTECAELFTQLGADELAAKLSAALSTMPIDVPNEFSAGPEVRMFVLDMTVEDRIKAHQLVDRAVSEGLVTSRTEARGLGGFTEAWAEFVRFT